MENYKKKALQLLVDLTFAEKKNPSVIPFTPAKTETSKKENKYFPRRIGGKGYKLSGILTSMLKELEAEPRANLHSIMVIKDGEVVAEASAPGYDTNLFHLAHSMSKTVTGLGIGFLYDRGKIDLNAKVNDFFPEVSFKDEKLSDMTVYHLLTMRSGVKFAELGTVTEENWTKAFFESEAAFEPGNEFMYNSINSYILARIIEKVSGLTLLSFTEENLFAPLGIENFFWEKSPEMIAKGGFGLYLSLESFAKIGVMILNGGIFEDRRIISKDFLALMTSLHSVVPGEKTGFNYGLHVWVDEENNETLLNGMLGQNVWISYKNRIVVAMNAGNNELFSDGPALAIVRKYLSSSTKITSSPRHLYKELKRAQDEFFDSGRDVRPLAEKRGLAYFLGFKNRYPFNKKWDALLGTYAFRDNNAGTLPMFVSVLQNNYSGGIEFFSFERLGNDLLLTSVEGGNRYEIPIGLYGFKESVLDFSGEEYIVRSIGEACENGDGTAAYKILLVFPELPNTKLITVLKSENGIHVSMTEMPNEKIAESYFDSLINTPKLNFITSILEKKLGEGFLKEKLEKLFNPEFEAISTVTPNWENIIASDNEKLKEEREKSAKFIKSLLPKTKDNEKDEKQKDDAPKLQGFFAKALSLLFGKAKPTDQKNSEKNDAQSTEASNDLIIEIPDEVITFLDTADE